VLLGMLRSHGLLLPFRHLMHFHHRIWQEMMEDEGVC